MTSASVRDRHFFACDLCDVQRTIHCDELVEAWGSLREEGWETFKDKGEWRHTCPKCSD